MNVIEMFCAVDTIKEFLCHFNWEYQMNNDTFFNEIVFNNLILYLQNLYEVGMVDFAYWKKLKIDFQKLCNHMHNIEKAAMDMDIVSLYDTMNFEIRQIIDEIGKILFKENNAILMEWIRRENFMAVKQRYPKLADQIELIDIDQEKNIREYGLRGNVVYRKSGKSEYDLYSMQSPSETGFRMAQRTDLRRYDKIYVLGFNGGYEFSGKYYISESKAKIEIYVINLIEFKQILSNTLRKGLLLNPNVNFRFNVEIEDFIQDIELQDKGSSYIYLTDSFGNRMNELQGFLRRNAYNTNIQEPI